MFKKMLMIAALPLMLTGCYETGTGTKIGVITKVGSGEGIINKTIEAEIVRGGFSSGSGASGQSFHFTIQSPELAKKMEEAMEKQQEVKITYRTELFTPFSSASSNFLTSVDVIDNKPKAPVKDEAPTVVSTATSSNAKIVQLLQVQAQLINEIVAEQNRNQATPK
jgi:hypothetical protein